MMPIWFIKYWQIGLAAVALIGGFLGGWTVRDWKADASALKAERAASAERDRLTTKMAGLSFEYEKTRAELEPARHDTKTTLREIYRDVPVSGDCALRDDARGLLETARHRSNAAATGKSGD